jgi:hypothetical protein
MTDWALYLDESGQFEKPRETVTIAGLLVNHSRPGPSAVELDAALRRAFPEFPWPFHRAYLLQPAYVALAAAHTARRRPGRHYRGDLVRAAEEAVAWLETGCAEETRATGAAIDGGQEPDYDHLSRLSRRLREGRPGLAALFETVTREVWEHVRQTAALIAGTAEEPRAFLAVSSETRVGDSGPGADERYFALLQALLQRTRALLEARTGEHRVSVQVLGRSLVDPVVSARRPLMMQDVDRVIAQVMSDAPPLLRFRSERVARYDPTIEVPFVLADAFANQTRRVLREPGLGLGVVERSLRTSCGVPVRSGAPPRTHLAAAGDALRLLRGELRDLEPGDGRQEWAVEQAREWCGRV